MYPEPSEHPPADRSGPTPSPAVRERVLRHCRRAMAERHTARRRWKQRWRWGLAAGAAALLLINAAAEHQSSERVAVLVSGGAPMAAAAPPAGAVDSLRTRRLLLAALLRDPNSL